MVNGLTATNPNSLGNLLLQQPTADGDQAQQLQLYMMLAKMLMGQQGQAPQAALPTLAANNIPQSAGVAQPKQDNQLQQMLMLRALMQQNPNLLMGANQ